MEKDFLILLIILIKNSCFRDQGLFLDLYNPNWFRFTKKRRKAFQYKVRWDTKPRLFSTSNGNAQILWVVGGGRRKRRKRKAIHNC